MIMGHDEAMILLRRASYLDDIVNVPRHSFFFEASVVLHSERENRDEQRAKSVSTYFFGHLQKSCRLKGGICKC